MSDEINEEEVERLNVDSNNEETERNVTRSGRELWGKAREKTVETSKIKKMVNVFQSNTRSFLGVNSPSVSHLPTNDSTLNNWNERTFKILSSNFLFGGKIKDQKIEHYLRQIDDEETGESGSFKYFKHTNRRIDEGCESLSGLVKRKMNRALVVTGIAKESDNDRVDANNQFSGEPGQAYVGIERRPSAVEENLNGPCDAFTHAFTSKRVLGIGFCGRLFDNHLDPEKRDEFKELLKSVEEHRPYFTYWMTFVQIVICFVSIFAYGLAPVGFSYEFKKGTVTTISLEKQIIQYPIKQNFWIGPASMDLVHLGAKYAPCMRNDSIFYSAIKKDFEKEKETGCCVRNDRGGCVQTDQETCLKLESDWHKWGQLENQGPMYNETYRRTSGAVCGLDPRFNCGHANQKDWPDDISQWPMCERLAKTEKPLNSDKNSDPHMHCEVIGRPCCIGIQGQCIITTAEQCRFMRGYFHNEANLCSQVDCMQEVCGMLDFLNQKSPDQVYRLFTSIFIHAGILQLIFTIFIQIFIVRDVEKLAGCLRVAIIYIGSGVIGNLASAIFLPYQAEVGPMGSQFGIFACLYVETYHAWHLYEKPWLVMLKMTALLIGLFLFGFLPMIDNFANVFGFLSGLFLGSILFPDVNLGGKCKRAIIIAVSVSIVVIITAALIVLFYVKPIGDCKGCRFFSCPFGPNWCLEMDYNITRIVKF